jgi:hypothetical protein
MHSRVWIGSLKVLQALRLQTCYYVHGLRLKDLTSLLELPYTTSRSGRNTMVSLKTNVVMGTDAIYIQVVDQTLIATGCCCNLRV